MTERHTSNASRKDQVFDTLRREILAARLKVTLDEQLKRPTSVEVQRLSQMKLPPIVRRIPDRAAGQDMQSSASASERPATTFAPGIATRQR
ncbi:hypothetical protein ACX80L_08375 [Arthrobacter sp. MDT1-48-3]